MNRSEDAVARLVDGLGSGHEGAVDELFDLVYDELKSLAHQQRRRWRGNHTMNTTALVHEAYVKIVGQARVEAADRAHFRALASRAMRHVLCNYARERGSLKRGEGVAHVPLDEALDAADAGPGSDRSEETLAALGAALEEFEAAHPRACRVVECRFFGGMTVEDTAVAVGASTRSVKRDWAMAQAWLHRAMESGHDLAAE